MAIESLEKAIQNEELPVQSHGVVTNTIVLAGLILRHKLLPNRYLLEGFIIEDEYFNQNNFQFDGIHIEYYDNEVKYFKSRNNKLYSKIVVDGKKNPFSNLIEKNDNKFYHRNNSSNSPFDFYYKNEGEVLWASRGDGKNKFEYYLFETTTSNVPECVANKIFALCKHVEEGKFKYSIFNLNEIVPEI